jgi:hypothetical protein
MKTQRFERIKGTCGRPFDTVNIAKDERRAAVYQQAQNRFCALADKNGRLPTDFRTSAFDLFTKLATTESFYKGPWRIHFRQTWRKIIRYLTEYRLKAAKQYAAGYFEKPYFLNG